MSNYKIYIKEAEEPIKVEVTSHQLKSDKISFPPFCNNFYLFGEIPKSEELKNVTLVLKVNGLKDEILALCTSLKIEDYIYDADNTLIKFLFFPKKSPQSAQYSKLLVPINNIYYVKFLYKGKILALLLNSEALKLIEEQNLE